MAKRKYATPEEARRAQLDHIRDWKRAKRRAEKVEPRPARMRESESSRISRRPSPEQVDEMVAALVTAGEEVPKREVKDWLRRRAEGDLFFFNKWLILDMDPEKEAHRLKLGGLHQEMCAFLTDFSNSRRKLLMIPMGHLKTTHASHALPLHILIQRKENNLYFPGRDGRETRGLLGNENTDKCIENLGVVRKHLEENVWLAWLWPEVCWENPLRDSPRWTNNWIEVPRRLAAPEPSITAIGADTGIFGRHYDWQVLDDIAGLKAGQSYQMMSKAKVFKRGCDTRFHSRAAGSHCIQWGVGTHQGADDVYVEWQRQPGLDLMIRAIEEGGQPLWPEEYTMDAIEALRKDTDPIHWALWYMNKPVSTQYTALDWNSLREFRFDTEPRYLHHFFNALYFDDHEADTQLEIRRAAMTAQPLMKLAHGVPLTPVPGNRALMLKRYFGKGGMSQGQQEYLREKYPEKLEKQ
jgi:hypothetical protein